LNQLDPVTDVFDGLLGKGNGQQVIEVACVAAVAQVFAVTERLVALQKVLDVFDEANIQIRLSAKV
jgi:hypothetical protein